MPETVIPQHIGFILDGNRRWARQQSIPEFDGHLAGYNALREVIERTFERGVPYMSVYAFSTENWQRNETEVSNIMKLTLHAISKDLKTLVRNKIKVRFLSRRDGLSSKLLASIEKAEDATRHFTEHTLAVCFNYGGKQEIVDAVKRAISDGITANTLTENVIAERLYAADVPPIDIVVRTSGEQRLSNFMLWRAAYSELMFIEKYWPDMTKADVDGIIEEYNRRSRRFGG